MISKKEKIAAQQRAEEAFLNKLKR